jgi:two-component system, NarL family, nitrate/nitrite response regulator NarL
VVADSWIEEYPMNNEPTLIRIVIADHKPIFRQILRESLESEPGLHVLGEASDTREAVQLIRQLKPDILLIDFALSRGIELEAQNGIGRDRSAVRVVVMVAALEKADIVEAFRSGAHGVVLRGVTQHILFESIRSVMTGHYWLESESLGVLVEALREYQFQDNGIKSPRDYGLTRREVDIMTMIANGHSNKEVGQEFSISERTVKHHLTNIFGKVGVASRLQLALFAVNHHVRGNPTPSLALPSLQLDEEA